MKDADYTDKRKLRFMEVNIMYTPKGYYYSEEVNKLIGELLDKSFEENITIWLVEEETGESLKLYDYLNSEKHYENGIFKRIS